MTMWPLSEHGAAGGLQAFKIDISAKRRTPPEELPVHEGHDWLYVLHGRLRLVLGAEDFTIEPGEAVEFTTWTPHWFGAVDGPVAADRVLRAAGAEGAPVSLSSLAVRWTAWVASSANCIIDGV